jgi:hypothetical protein
MTTLTHDHHHDHDHPIISPRPLGRFDLLAPIRRWLNDFEVKDAQLAHHLCRVIPCQCAFERDLYLFGKTLHIPALCKLNPLYEEVVYLRFRAMSYLADVCHEDISQYC